MDPVVPAAVEPESDFAAFEARENAVAIGQTPDPVLVPEPKPDPTPEPDPDPDTEPAPDKSVTPPQADSKRTERRVSRQQEQINETIRRAVTEATEATERRLRAELGKPAEAVTSEPAAKDDEFQFTKPRPTEAEFETYGDFTEALADWKFDQRAAKAAFEAEKTQRAEAETSNAQEFETKKLAWFDRRDSFIDKNPAKAARLTAFLDGIHTGTPVGDVIFESEVGAEIADYLDSNPTEAERIARLPPIKQLVALGKIEARFDNTTSASASTAGPAAKTVTSAPAAPTTLASRSAIPADPAAAALASGDFAAWEAEENRKAILASR